MSSETSIVKEFTMLVVTSILLLCPFSATSQQAEVPLSLSDADKTEIMRLILEERLAFDGEDKFKEYLVLASDNIKPSMVPRIKDFRVTLARKKDLERRAQRTPGGLKWMFFDFSVQGQRVKVDFVQRLMAPGKPPLVPPLVRGPHYYCFFRKVSGKWEGTCPYSIC